jgi:hypothetical protein
MSRKPRPRRPLDLEILNLLVQVFPRGLSRTSQHLIFTGREPGAVRHARWALIRDGRAREVTEHRWPFHRRDWLYAIIPSADEQRDLPADFDREPTAQRLRLPVPEPVILKQLLGIVGSTMSRLPEKLTCENVRAIE